MTDVRMIIRIDDCHKNQFLSELSDFLNTHPEISVEGFEVIDSYQEDSPKEPTWKVPGHTALRDNYLGKRVEVIGTYSTESILDLEEEYRIYIGEFGTITELDTYADYNFEGCYWEVLLDNGSILVCFPGTNLWIMEDTDV